MRETEKLIQQQSRVPKGLKSKAAARATDPNVKSAEAKMRRALGTRVMIAPHGSRAGGTIQIEYYDDRDLDRLYRLLMPSTLDN